MRVQQRRALPPQCLERAAAAALGALVCQLGLRLRHAGRSQHLSRQGRRQPEPHHHLDEAPPAQVAGFDLRDQLSQSMLVHLSVLLAGVGIKGRTGGANE